MKRFFVVLIGLFLITPFIAFAHGGRTDSNGGHKDGDDYHYHHGFPAHYHYNGECEYEDQTPVYESHSSTSKNNKKINLEFDNKETSNITSKISSATSTKDTSPLVSIIQAIVMFLLEASVCALIFLGLIKLINRK